MLTSKAQHYCLLFQEVFSDPLPQDGVQHRPILGTPCPENLPGCQPFPVHSCLLSGSWEL